MWKTGVSPVMTDGSLVCRERKPRLQNKSQTPLLPTAETAVCHDSRDGLSSNGTSLWDE